MGKKKIITKDGETTAPEAAEVSVAPKKASAKKQVLNGTAVINVSYNNTLISIADSKGQVISWSSAGLLGFKGSKKSTPYASNFVAKNAF